MEFLAYHRDRPGSMPLREALVERHWAYMDAFQPTMIARGPTIADDGETATGSVHVLDLPDAPGARLVSNIVDVTPADVTIGMRVQVDFTPIADGWMLPVFRAQPADPDGE